MRLERFIEAQARVYDQALAELRAGQKQSHWMWFIFPQIAGLGQSPTSRAYAIQSLDEARLQNDAVAGRIGGLVLQIRIAADVILRPRSQHEGKRE